MLSQIRSPGLCSALRKVFGPAALFGQPIKSEIADVLLVIEQQTGLIVRLSNALVSWGEEDGDSVFSTLISALWMGAEEARQLQAAGEKTTYAFSHLAVIRAGKALSFKQEGGRFIKEGADKESALAFGCCVIDDGEMDHHWRIDDDTHSSFGRDPAELVAEKEEILAKLATPEGRLKFNLANALAEKESISTAVVACQSGITERAARKRKEKARKDAENDQQFDLFGGG